MFGSVWSNDYMSVALSWYIGDLDRNEPIFDWDLLIRGLIGEFGLDVSLFIIMGILLVIFYAISNYLVLVVFQKTHVEFFVDSVKFFMSHFVISAWCFLISWVVLAFSGFEMPFIVIFWALSCTFVNAVNAIRQLPSYRAEQRARAAEAASNPASEAPSRAGDMPADDRNTSMKTTTPERGKDL